MKKKIYIAGPYTKGDVAINVRDAIDAGDYLTRFGWIPFIPHLTHFWHLMYPHTDINFWYDYDLVWLRHCDALLRLPGESVGSDREVKIAEEMGIPTYYGLFSVPRDGA